MVYSISVYKSLMNRTDKLEVLVDMRKHIWLLLIYASKRSKTGSLMFMVTIVFSQQNREKKGAVNGNISERSNRSCGKG